jgi:hypothetical protein
LVLAEAGKGVARSEPLPLPPADQARVAQAVRRGVIYLKKSQGPLGTWADDKGTHPYGYAALPGLALLEGGVAASHSSVQRAVSYLRQNLDKITNTYEVALTILFLDRLSTLNDQILGRVEDEAIIRQIIELLALRLIYAQTISGGWTYGPRDKAPALTPAMHRQLLAALAAEPSKLLGMARKHRWLADVPALNEPAFLMGKDVKFGKDTDDKPQPKDKETATKPDQKPQSAAVDVLKETSDNSCTQFATLAVWVAQRHKVPVEKSIKLIVKRFRSSQNADGSWGYAYKRGGGVPEVAPLIGAGLVGLAVERGLDDPLAKTRTATAKKAVGQLAAAVGAPTLVAQYLATRAVKQAADAEAAVQKRAQEPHRAKAFEALTKHIGDPAGRFADLPQGNLYFLWALERVAMLYDLQTIGGKDWYRWGAEVLVANQKPDGQWEGSGYPGSSATIDTCFALLFLTQANLAEDLTDKLKMDVAARNQPAAVKPPPVPEPRPATPPVKAPESKPAGVDQPETASAAPSTPTTPPTSPPVASRTIPRSSESAPVAASSTAPEETGHSRPLLWGGAAVAVLLIGVAVTLLILGLQEKKGPVEEEKPRRSSRRSPPAERGNGRDRDKRRSKVQRRARSSDPDD